MSEIISELQLGNGTSLLIFANIASALPTSLGATLQQATQSDASNLVGVFHFSGRRSASKDVDVFSYEAKWIGAVEWNQHCH